MDLPLALRDLPAAHVLIRRRSVHNAVGEQLLAVHSPRWVVARESALLVGELLAEFVVA